MFLPNFNAAAQKAAERELFDRIEGWCVDIIPADIRGEAQVSVQEVQCGDPECSPIDTVITIIFNSGGRGMMGLPMEAKEVTVEELKESYPTEDVLRKWHNGEEAEWPPEPELNEDRMPTLRFEVGTKVLCRVGATEWHGGTVLQKWYREQSWPPGAWAPYKIALDDGRNIFAPGDLDQIIKLAPTDADAAME